MNSLVKLKLKKRNVRIMPSDDDDDAIPSGVENHSYQQDSPDANNRKLSKKLQNKIDQMINIDRGLEVITNVKAGASKWRKYATQRRLHKTDSTGNEDKDSGNASKGGLGLDEIHEDFVSNVHEKHGKTVLDGFKNNKLSLKATLGTGNINKMTAESNRALISYFAELGKKQDESVCVNLEFIEALITGGARIDCTDKYGQTVLHEVARAWHIDVARFLIEHKADVNQADQYGRTPLHVAAAVDYPEMVNLLIGHGADKEARTLNENQTPVHYAAKNDACSSLRALVKNECEYKDVRDFKGRTPIHLAAELDRSETARVLLDLGAPVGVSDNSGQKAITWMIIKMAPVAKEALNQFYTTDRANRRQYYRLDLLVQDDCMQDKLLDNAKDSCAPSPLQVITTYHQYELVLHPCMKRLLDIQWMKFGRLGAWFQFIWNLIYILMWTTIGAVVNYDERHNYVLPEQWWRIVLFGTSVLLTAYQITDELIEYFRSKKVHNRWKQWREREIDYDLQYTHPRWPEERSFLINEKEEMDATQPKYFNDPWNIFDWIVYTLLLASITTHIVDIIAHSEMLARAHIRVMAVTIILLWLRLMKFARAFTLLGPFIVMLGHMIGDVLRFLFIYLEFYIPFVCAFWMIFGGDNKKEEIGGANGKQVIVDGFEYLNAVFFSLFRLTLVDAYDYAVICAFWMIFGGENKKDENAGEGSSTVVIVDGFQYVNAVFFSLFRLTLVDDYDYASMKKVDGIMADLLLGAWLALSAILCLNLLIALLSETFQRVYDNAQANAVMQKAITIQNVWDGMSNKRKRKFMTYIKSSCAPLMDYYDDDMTVSGEEDLKKVTLQIKSQLDVLGVKCESILDDHLQHVDQMDDLIDRINEGRSGDGGDITSTNSSTGIVTIEKFENEIEILREGIREIQTRQEDMSESVNRNMKEIRHLLQNISGVSTSLEKQESRTATRPTTTSEDGGLLFQRSHHSIPEESELQQTSRLRERRDESSGHVKHKKHHRRRASTSQESGLHYDEADIIRTSTERKFSSSELSSSTPAMEVTTLGFDGADSSSTVVPHPEPPRYSSIDPFNTLSAPPVRIRSLSPEVMPDEQPDPTSEC